MDKNANLKEFLATGKITEPVAGEVTVETVDAQPSDPVFVMMADLAMLEMLAKDLHYRAKGKPFYGLHELADLVWEIGKSRDDVNEVYYMGEKQVDPPMQYEIFSSAAEKCKGLCCHEGETEGEDCLIAKLADHSRKVADDVEEIKKAIEISSGFAAVIDDISKKSLQAVALLKRTEKTTDVTPDAASVVVVGP